MLGIFSNNILDPLRRFFVQFIHITGQGCFYGNGRLF